MTPLPALSPSLIARLQELGLENPTLERVAALQAYLRDSALEDLHQAFRRAEACGVFDTKGGAG
jgi:muramoyltetrapeptide carboxypeptidase LdcA involved in peptidoglycan recycling